MNREDRRNLIKNGASKETVDKLQAYNKPCSVLEVVKISRAVAEDVANESLEEYRRLSTGTIVAMTIQLEILKSLVINSGMITEEEFQSLYETSAREFEEKQREYLAKMKEQENQEAPSNVVKFDPSVNPVEVTVLPREEEET